MQKRTRLPYDLQFFAEDADPTPEPAKDEGEDADSVEALKQQLAEERATQAKNKAALDKALKQVGDLTKQLRSKQTQQEIDEEAKRTEEEKTKEYIAALEAYKHETEAKERYLLQGMDTDMAKKAAAAEVAGDMDALVTIQKQYTDSVIKAKEAEWKKSMPKAYVGDGSYPAMTKEEILAIKDDEERTKAIAQHLNMFT